MPFKRSVRLNVIQAQTMPGAWWIAAFHKLATDDAYGKLPGGFARGKDMEHKRIRLTQKYLEAGEKIVDEQIAKAGYRLAEVLNRALGD